MERARSSGKKTSIRTDQAKATAEMGKVTDTREIEQAIPRVRYATDICLTKMSLGLKYIAAKLTGGNPGMRHYLRWLVCTIACV